MDNGRASYGAIESARRPPVTHPHSTRAPKGTFLLCAIRGHFYCALTAFFAPRTYRPRPRLVATPDNSIRSARPDLRRHSHQSRSNAGATRWPRTPTDGDRVPSSGMSACASRPCLVPFAASRCRLGTYGRCRPTQHRRLCRTPAAGPVTPSRARSNSDGARLWLFVRRDLWARISASLAQMPAVGTATAGDFRGGPAPRRRPRHCSGRLRAGRSA